METDTATLGPWQAFPAMKAPIPYYQIEGWKEGMRNDGTLGRYPHVVASAVESANAALIAAAPDTAAERDRLRTQLDAALNRLVDAEISVHHTHSGGKIRYHNCTKPLCVERREFIAAARDA